MKIIKSEKTVVKKLKKDIVLAEFKLDEEVYKLTRYETENNFVKLSYISHKTELEVILDKTDGSYETSFITGC